MDNESPPPFASLDEEEAALRARLDKIAQFRALARELGMPVTMPGAIPAALVQTPQPQSFDGTIASLVQSYRTHEKSPFRNLKYRIQNNYIGTLNRISNDFGHHRVADLNADRVWEFYNQWAEGGKLSMGHALAAKLRLLSGFGATVLNDDDCIRFGAIMRALRFPIAEKRLVVMEAEHAIAFRNKAHELGWPSMALAQAIQFELKLRQVTTIGEWIPLSDPAPSSIVWGNEKWVRGLRWSDLDDKLILRFTVHDKLKRNKDHAVDLSEKKMVLEELDKLPSGTPNTGPMIICEPTGRPYSHSEFRRKWRIVATKAGLPDNVRNSDSVRAESVQEEKEKPLFARLVK
jgi:hypothetical protein